MVPPACFVIVHNVSKKSNVGTLARSAAAFGVKELCIVGRRKFNTFGSHGSTDYVQFKHFATLEECCKYLKEEQGCEIVGVEIDDGALPVNEHPFNGPTAFILGNEGTGLSDKQMSVCDRFTYIPQYGAGTASLNVTVAASIVLHQFAVWAGYEERSRIGPKFVVGERPQRTAPRGEVGLSREELEQIRNARKANLDKDVILDSGEEKEDDSTNTGFFGGMLE